MYVHIRSEPGLRTVGHYSPDGRFEPESDHTSEESAAARVHYLNGGNDETLPGMPRETFNALVEALHVVTTGVEKAISAIDAFKPAQ